MMVSIFNTLLNFSATIARKRSTKKDKVWKLDAGHLGRVHWLFMVRI